MDANVLHECLALALEGRLSFPDTVRRMQAIGVERYHADLVLLHKTHYAADGRTHVEPIALPAPPAIAARFSAEGVQEAIRAIQQGAIAYPEFLRRIMAAGTVGYQVYLHGRRAVYAGRDGDCHVEHFPQAG